MRTAICVILLSCVTAVCGMEPLSDVQYEKLAESFLATDSFAQLMFYLNFERDIDAGERLAVLSEIWRRNETGKNGSKVCAGIVDYLLQKTANWQTDPVLEAQVFSRIADDNIALRHVIFSLICKTFPRSERLKPIAMMHMRDKDEQLRSLALCAIREFKGGNKVLEYYIALHVGDAGYKSSLGEARNQLSKYTEW